MSRHSTLARLAAERRDDARAETRIALGNVAKRYAGETPLDAHPKYVRPYTMGERQTRMRRGTVERVAGGGTKFKPCRDEEPKPRIAARSYGGNVGDAIVDLEGQPCLLARPASMPRPEGK